MSHTTVLVIDDSPDIRALVRRALAPVGFTVIESANGPDAIRLARQCSPALILLDLCLPGLDGWDVVRQIRTDPALEEVPVVIMTGYGALLAARALGSIDVQRIICKPFDLNYLAYTVTILASSGQPAPPEAAAGASETERANGSTLMPCRPLQHAIGALDSPAT